MRSLLATLSAWLALGAGPLCAAELHIATAANFAAPLQKLTPLFERATGHTLALSTGSSGQLYARIRQAAPFDVFLSADTEKPQLLEQQGLTVPGSRFVYAIGTLLLWSPRPDLVDGGGAVLGQGRYRLLAIANPETAPYGTAARQVLMKLGLWDALYRDHKIVLGENITQAWQFAASGNADLAFVALSQVLGPDGAIAGSSWRVPQSMYDRIEQAAVIIAASPQQQAAHAFVNWLRSDPAALAAIRAAGYDTAD